VRQTSSCCAGEALKVDYAGITLTVIGAGIAR
jgi:hypothetical protein